MQEKKFRIPRNNKKQIPKGVYCYTYLNAIWQDGRYKGYKIKPCPFYKHVDGLDGYCNLVKCEIVDQVKDCGLKHEF